MSKCCGNCAWLYPEMSMEEWRRYALGEFEPKEGQCRRFPPSIPGAKSGEDWFPSVRAEDWCGEHTEGTYQELGFE